MTLGEKIRFLRMEKGITQESLAEEINVSRSAIAKWETNNGVPEISNLKMLSNIFGVSVDDLINDIKEIKVADIKSAPESKCSEYTGKYYDIELTGWNDGVTDVLILCEDNNFLFYKKPLKKRTVFGLIGKKFITSVTASKQPAVISDDANILEKNYFYGKHVSVELGCREGFLKGFFDFRNDDHRDVIIQSFSDSKVLLKYGKEIEINAISKIEELDA